MCENGAQVIQLVVTFGNAPFGTFVQGEPRPDVQPLQWQHEARDRTVLPELGGGCPVHHNNDASFNSTCGFCSTQNVGEGRAVEFALIETKFTKEKTKWQNPSLGEKVVPT
jgi:hypothetical protein